MQEIQQILNRHRERLNFENEIMDSKDRKSMDSWAMQEFIDAQTKYIGLNQAISHFELDKTDVDLRDNIEQC